MGDIMRTVHLIRHGKPISNWGEVGADPDPGLDAQGISQAEEAAQVLAALPEDARPVRIVSSPLRRCRETAEPLSRLLGLPVEIEPGVAEIPSPKGLAGGARTDWLRGAFSKTWRQIEGDIDYALWAANVARTVAQYPGGAVFSHFVSINAAASFALQNELVVQFEPGHASITRFQIEPGGGLLLVEKGASAVTQVL